MSACFPYIVMTKFDKCLDFTCVDCKLSVWYFRKNLSQYLGIWKHLKGDTHSSWTSLFSFSRVKLIGGRFKSTFWSMHAWAAKFTASKKPNSLLQLCVNAIACSKIQSLIWKWPAYMCRLWKWDDCILGFTELQV